MITEYENYCLICGRPNVEVHHLCFGRANRKLSDEDGLTMPLCRVCHDELHRNKQAAMLSRILGQAIYEQNHTREEFRKRYGQSYI